MAGHEASEVPGSDPERSLPLPSHGGVTFNVFADYEIPGLQQIASRWLSELFPPGVLWYPTDEPFSDLTGLPAGVAGFAFDPRSSCSEADFKHGIELGRKELNVVVHRLYDDKDLAVKESIEDQLRGSSDDLELPIRTEMLPSKKLMTAWSDLVFEPAIHDQILRSLDRTVRFMKPRHRTPATPCSKAMSRMFNGMVLLWGPPGSGKSSLCRALAQTLSVRFKEDFQRTVLVEIDAHSLHSKYFGESARLVQETFDRISSLLDGERPPLVCVLIDEVESMASSRDNGSGSGNEPKDAMRALNALLTAVDRMRDYHSLLVFCTSNIINAMDKAFLDRFDFKWQIPEPDVAASYEILRRRYTQLMDSGAITQSPWREVELRGSGQDHSGENGPGQADEGGNEVVEIDSSVLPSVLPPYESLVLYTSDKSYAVPRQLAELATMAAGISARTLCKMPWTSMVFHTDSDVVTLAQAMTALEKTLRSEALARVAGQKPSSWQSSNVGTVYG